MSSLGFCHLELLPKLFQGHFSAPYAFACVQQGTGMGVGGAVLCGILMLLLHMLLIPHIIMLKIRKLIQKIKVNHPTSLHPEG